MDKGHHSSLWLDAKTFWKFQIRYLLSETTTVHNSQWPQRLEIHKITDSGQLANDHIPTGTSLNDYFYSPTPPKFVLAWVHNIWKVSVRLFVGRGPQNVVVSKNHITKKEMLNTGATGRRQTYALSNAEMYYVSSKICLKSCLSVRNLENTHL